MLQIGFNSSWMVYDENELFMRSLTTLQVIISAWEAFNENGVASERSEILHYVNKRKENIEQEFVKVISLAQQAMNDFLFSTSAKICIWI